MTLIIVNITSKQNLVDYVMQKVIQGIIVQKLVCGMVY